MATNGQFSWPSVGSSVAAHGQLVTATDTLALVLRSKRGSKSQNNTQSSM